MKTDHELLAFAAKAVGGYRYIEDQGFIEVLGNGGNGKWWNPITDDGDALRLAVKLHLDIRFYWDGRDDQYNTVEAYTHGANKDAEEPIGFYLRDGQIDEDSSTRRAIVRAAAAIGESMK